MHQLAVSLTCVLMLVVPTVAAITARSQGDEELE